MDNFEDKILEYCEKADGKDALAVAHILLDMRKSDRERLERAEKAAKTTKIMCIVCCIACLITCVVFTVLASGIDIEYTTTTTTTTTTVDQDASDGGNVIYQAGENSKYYASGGDFE